MSFVDIESNEEALLGKLLRFYKSNDQHLVDLASISSQNTIISLREMDFLVTKYSKKSKICYNLPDGRLFNLNLDYKAQLRGHSKKRFDPFCRLGDKNDSGRLGRFFIDFETKTPEFLSEKTPEELEEYRSRKTGVVTNVGQMNFFRWAINNKVVEYCFTNKNSIVEVMDEEYKSKKKAKVVKIPEEKSNKEISKFVVQFP